MYVCGDGHDVQVEFMMSIEPNFAEKIPRGIMCVWKFGMGGACIRSTSQHHGLLFFDYDPDRIQG